MKKIIAIINDKGGVGKTTTTINVGAFLAYARFKTLLIDCSKQANSSRVISGGKIFEKGIGNYILKDCSIEEILQETDYENLHLLPGTRSIREIKVVFDQMKTSMGQEYILNRLEGIKKLDYDYILIDCDPDFNALSDIVIYTSDSFIVPLQPAEFSLDGVVEVLKEITRIKDMNGSIFNKDVQIRLLISQYEKSKKKILDYTLKELDPFLHMVFKSKIRNLSIIEDAHKHKIPVMYHDSESEGTQDFKKLTEEIINIWK